MAFKMNMKGQDFVCQGVKGLEKEDSGNRSIFWNDENI